MHLCQYDSVVTKQGFLSVAQKRCNHHPELQGHESELHSPIQGHRVSDLMSRVSDLPTRFFPTGGDIGSDINKVKRGHKSWDKGITIIPPHRLERGDTCDE